MYAAATLLLAGVLFAAAVYWELRGDDSRVWVGHEGEWVALGSLTFAGYIFSAIIYARRFVIRYFANGVERSGWFGSRTILWDDVEKFVYRATRHSTNGVYGGTEVFLKFVTRSFPARCSISHRVFVKEKSKPFSLVRRIFLNPLPLLEVRDHVAARLAGSRRNALASGKTVDWADGIQLIPNGLIIQRTGQVLMIGELEKAEFGNGTLSITGRGSDRPNAVLKAKSPNFWVGWMLFQEMLGKANLCLEATDDAIADECYRSLF